MKPVEFFDGAVQIDASLIAEGLGIALPLLKQQMRSGAITSLAERGTDADFGRHRLTFFSAHRRFRLVVDAFGGDHPAIGSRFWRFAASGIAAKAGVRIVTASEANLAVC